MLIMVIRTILFFQPQMVSFVLSLYSQLVKSNCADVKLTNKSRNYGLMPEHVRLFFPWLLSHTPKQDHCGVNYDCSCRL